MPAQSRNIKFRLLIAGAIALAVVVVLLSRRYAEPSYAGRSLSYWLEKIGSVDFQDGEDPEVALRAIGTNALPTLIKALRLQPFMESGTFWDKLEAFWTEHDLPGFSFIEQKFIARKHLRYLVFRARNGFEYLGDIAEPAIPQLEQMLMDTNYAWGAAECLGSIGWRSLEALSRGVTNADPVIRSLSLYGIERVGNEAANVVPLLVASLNDVESSVRQAAAEALGRIGADPLRVVPLLSAMLSSSDFRDVSGAINGLGRFGTNAQSAVPQIAEKLLDPKGRYTTQAMRSLRAVSTNSVPWLRAALQHTNSNVKTGVLGELSELMMMGASTSELLPDIIMLVSSTNSEVREAARTAVFAIDAKAAEAAGVDRPPFLPESKPERMRRRRLMPP